MLRGVWHSAAIESARYAGGMSTSPLPAWLASLLFVISCNVSSAVEVMVDLRAAPECQAFADVATKLIVEWTPKVHKILDGADAPLADRTVKLTFRPMDGVAHTKGSEIVISSEWVTKKAPEDYGMVIHELVHVRQFMEGKKLFDANYDYAERPTEVEAYRHAVEEARRLGLNDDQICNYLKTEWMSREDLRTLAKALNVRCE